ncbi:MAG: alpha-L-arabinofuranosidase, partial [Propionibacteriaceae bacterium]|nr:alpha-L-arabinofuranosidase [Propionibacteriaceae bacterium]
ERMPSFGTWESTVLEHTYDHVDLVSLHGYYEKTGDDRAGYLASADAMDAFIRGVVATCDHVAARRRIRRRMMLSFDEWNLEPRAEADDRLWTVGRRISEDSYDVEDAVAVGGLLISLLRNSDRVAIACLAQLVNVMAPIRTEPGVPAWRQTIFHPFALTARHARGEVLRVEPRSPDRVATVSRGDVAPVDAVATFDPESRRIALFAVNRSPSDAALLQVELRGTAGWQVVEHLRLGGRDWELANTAAEPDRVRPEASRRHRLDGTRLEVELPPASWTILRLVASPG